MKKLYLTTGVFLALAFTAIAQGPVSLFSSRVALSEDYHKIAARYQSLVLDKNQLATLHKEAPASVSLALPFEHTVLLLELKKKKITADRFTVIEALADGSRREVAYEDGVFYQGVVSGSNGRSFATISIFNDQVAGIIADGQSNIVLGTIEKNGNPTEEYVLYRENALQIANPNNCFTSDVPVDGIQTREMDDPQPTVNAVGEPVDIYFECDYRFYQDKSSSTTNVINYVLGFFNNTELLYANENIKIQVSQILVWTTQDPEAAAGLNSSSAVLSSFSNRMSSASYIGDYAAFLSTRSLGGGIAWLTSNACTAGKYYRCSVSGINNTYANFPTYSWTVEVVTHELGHNLGSNHTQWCGWPGGALDNCVATEPSPAGAPACPRGPQPTNGGTIMSYCHLTSTGINFNNGFGALPGQKIRDYVSARTCFGTCRMTIAVSKTDASCGLTNGTATVTASAATGALTITWSNGQTGTTLANAAPGTYHVTVTDAANCQVMEDVVIGNTGTTLAFNLTPASASFCTGGNVTLSATANAGYTYQWSRNGSPISGATASSYIASQAGNYSVQVASGACTGNRSVTVTQLNNPVVLVTPAAATIEKFQSQTLTASGATSYNWSAQPALVSSTVNTGVVKPLTTTTYLIEGTDANNCKATASTTISVIGCGEVTNITTTSYSPSRVLVQWKNPEGSASDTLRYRIKGSTAWTRIFVTGESHELNGLQPGAEYEYAVVPLCTTTATFIASTTRVFTTAALENGLYLRLFPNPATANTRLEVIKSQPYTLQVNIFDNTGKLVQQSGAKENLPAGQSIRPVSISRLPNGIYFVVAIIDGKEHYIKMSVVH